MFDDYPAILAFALRYVQTPSFGPKLKFVVAAQTGDYKLITEHTLVALDLMLTHQVHFSFLIWAGNLCGLATVWLLWRMCFVGQPLRDRLLLFLPIIYLFFQMNFVENYDWAMCGLQTFPAVFFSLASLHLVARKDTKLPLLACVCACIACFSSSNGFLIAPIGSLVYLGRKAWSQLILWVATFAAALSVYLYGYTPVPNVFRNENTSTVNRVLFFFSFLGSAAENQHRQPVKYGAVALGLCLFLIVVWAFSKKLYRHSPAAAYSAVWVILTAIPVLVYRLPAGFQYSLVMRYKIYSELLLILSYILLAGFFSSLPNARAHAKVAYVVVLAASIGYTAGTDVIGYKYLVKRQQRVALGLSYFVADPTQSPQITVSGDPIDPVLNERARLALTESLRSGIYRLPSRDRW